MKAPVVFETAGAFFIAAADAYGVLLIDEAIRLTFSHFDLEVVGIHFRLC